MTPLWRTYWCLHAPFWRRWASLSWELNSSHHNCAVLSWVFCGLMNSLIKWLHDTQLSEQKALQDIPDLPLSVSLLLSLCVSFCAISLYTLRWRINYLNSELVFFFYFLITLIIAQFTWTYHQYFLKELFIRRAVARRKIISLSCGMTAQSNLAKVFFSFISFGLSVIILGNSSCSLSRCLTGGSEVPVSKVWQDQAGWTEIRAGICTFHFVLVKAFHSSGSGTMRWTQIIICFWEQLISNFFF